MDKMDRKLSVLILEDSLADAELNAGMLRKAGYEICYKRIETEEEMAKALEQESWDLILSDYNMPLFSVQAALDIYHAHGSCTPFIVISGAIGEEKAIELIKAGVQDYVLKGNMARFILVVERALHDASEERKRIKLNKALANSEARYKSYIENAPDGVFVVDETGKYVEVNHAAYSMTGYSEEELLTMSITDILPDESPKEGIAHFVRLVETGSSKADLSFRHKNGTKRWWSMEAVKLTETRFLGFAKDITVRKDLEESLRIYQAELIMQNEELIAARSTALDAAEKYTELYDFAPTGYFTLADNKTIHEVNHSGASIFDIERSKLIGLQFDFFVSRETGEAFNVFFQKMRKNNVKNICEITIETRDYQKKYLHIEGRRLDSGNQYLINTVDITERKRAEDSFRKTATRLELATRAGGVGIWDLDLVRKKLDWDDQMFNIYGFNKLTFKPTFVSWLASIHPDDRERCKQEIKIAFNGDKEFDTAYRICWTDGSVHTIKATAVILRDGTGKPIRVIGINWDVTAEKTLEEKLKSSETNFRTFFESLDDIIVVGDTKGRIIHYNQALPRKLGYNDEELLRMQIIEMNPKELRSEAEQIIGDMFSGIRSVCPLPLARQDGSLLPAETRVWLGKWNGQDCIFGFSKDLSSEQEALQKFNKIFHSNPALMVISSFPDNVFTDVNDSFLSKTGYTRNEIIGKTSEDLQLFLQPEKHREAAEELEKNGFIHNFELQIRAKSGNSLHGLFSGDIIETQGTKFFLTVMIDISARKAAEEEIQRVNRFLDSIVENIPNMVFLKEANTLRFIRFNRAGEDLLGISRNELIGKNDYDFFSKKQADSFTRRDREVLQNRNMVDVVEETINTKGHGIRILHTKKVPIMDDRGEPEFLLGISEDITERKETETELQLRGEIIENMSEGVLLFRADNGVIVYANPTCEHMFRYNSEELIGKHVSIVNAPTDKSPEETAAEIIRQLKKGKVWQGEVRNIMKDGTRFWNQATISAFRHPQFGNVWISIQHDITERKRAEEELRKSEERFRHVSYTTSDVLYSCLSDGKGNYKIDWLTGAVERITGHTADELKAQKCWGTQVVAEDRDIFNKHVISLVPGASSSCELRLQHKSGRIVWVTSFAECVRNEEQPGQTYLYGGLVNITDRKITEQLLKESEEKHKTILNASPDGIIVTNLKGIITDVSEIGIELLGANSRNELIGKNFLRFVPSDEKNTVKEISEKTINEGLAQNIGLKIRKINQTVFAGETSATLIQGPYGAPVSYMLILRDISHRKKMETLQIHADRMASLGEMASGIAHEINQPLNIISMVMDKILFESAKSETISLDFLKSKSDKIFENITRVRNIIDHIRAFSRSHDDYVLTAFDINSSIENAVSMIAEQFKHLGINLNLWLEEKIPPIVGNTYKFEQVILNLLINAKDAVIEKKTSQEDYSEMLIGITSYQENHFIMVEVTDNGIGISNDDINNILLPFYTTKDEGKGTGLGLSICYQIVREMSGNIEITCDTVFGTRIKLVLDLQKKK
jgi:PAS domain S-box-containing protein